MKATGIVRRIDDLGRLVIPKEVRRTLGIKEDDPIEIFLDKEMICLRKYNMNVCVFCDSEAEFELHERKVCPSCMKKIYTGYRTNQGLGGNKDGNI